jgi:hypothetical protein
MANFNLIDFPTDKGRLASVNPEKITHIFDVMIDGEKYTEIVFEGGAKITIRLAFDQVKEKLKSVAGSL